MSEEESKKINITNNYNDKAKLIEVMENNKTKVKFSIILSSLSLIGAILFMIYLFVYIFVYISTLSNTIFDPNNNIDPNIPLTIFILGGFAIFMWIYYFLIEIGELIIGIILLTSLSNFKKVSEKVNQWMLSVGIMKIVKLIPLVSFPLTIANLVLEISAYKKIKSKLLELQNNSENINFI